MSTNESQVLDSIDTQTETPSTDSGVCRWHNNGYTYLSDGREICYEHHLTAVAGGADPYDVFANDEQCVHHQTHRSLNCPSTLQVLTDAEHARLHHDSGAWEYGDDGIPRLRLKPRQRIARPSELSLYDEAVDEI